MLNRLLAQQVKQHSSICRNQPESITRSRELLQKMVKRHHTNTPPSMNTRDPGAVLQMDPSVEYLDASYLIGSSEHGQQDTMLSPGRDNSLDRQHASAYTAMLLPPADSAYLSKQDKIEQQNKAVHAALHSMSGLILHELGSNKAKKGKASERFRQSENVTLRQESKSMVKELTTELRKFRKMKKQIDRTVQYQQNGNSSGDEDYKLVKKY